MIAFYDSEGTYDILHCSFADRATIQIDNAQPVFSRALSAALSKNVDMGRPDLICMLGSLLSLCCIELDWHWFGLYRQPGHGGGMSARYTEHDRA